MSITFFKIKVDKKIKPIHNKLRKKFSLTIGVDYFISFGRNTVFPCKLTGVADNHIIIEIPEKPRSNKRYLELNGYTSHNCKSTHIIFRDEIGRTPEEAVINTACIHNAVQVDNTYIPVKQIISEAGLITLSENDDKTRMIIGSIGGAPQKNMTFQYKSKEGA